MNCPRFSHEALAESGSTGRFLRREVSMSDLRAVGRSGCRLDCQAGFAQGDQFRFRVARVECLERQGNFLGVDLSDEERNGKKDVDMLMSLLAGSKSTQPRS